MIPVPERSQAFMNLPTPHIFYYECRSLVQGGDRGARWNPTPGKPHTHAAWVENYEDLEVVEPRAPKAS